MGLNMLYRYAAVLLVTVLLSQCPLPSAKLVAWCTTSLLSITYIAAIIYLSRIKESWIVAGIEAIAMVCAVTAFFQHYMALKSQFFINHYEHIMGYCFLAEIVVIITGMANSDEFKRILFVCIDYVTSDKRTYSNIYRGESFLCTTTQKTFRMQ